MHDTSLNGIRERDREDYPVTGYNHPIELIADAAVWDRHLLLEHIARLRAAAQAVVDKTSPWEPNNELRLAIRALAAELDGASGNG